MGIEDLDGLHLLVQQRGEIVGLLGPNGSGKPTLFNVLSGLVRPATGRIRFREHDITDHRVDQISRLGISRTFQLIRVFPRLSVLDNVPVGGTFGRSTGVPRMDDADLEGILATTNLLHLALQPASGLGIADRKRLEIARAVATHPRLLVLDEVIAGLAPPDARALLDLIRTIHRQGMTIMLIEHNMRAVMELAGRIIVLHHGEKIADSPPSQVVRDPLVVEAYLSESAAIFDTVSSNQ